MSNFPWQTPYRYAHSMGGDDQIEALQTDVMRFMAILGLCLMAVFSLVQSLPYQPQEKAPQLESKALLESEIQQLKESLSEMLDQIKQLGKTIKQKQQVQQKLAQLEQKIETQQEQLTALNKALQQDQKTLGKIRKELKQQKRTQQQQQIIVDKITQTSSKQKPQKKGFSLRFSSDQALLTLLQQQHVNLYLMMGQHAWKVVPKAINWQAIAVKPPKKYYQMSEQTVPSVLTQTVKRSLSAQSNSKVTWAVMLPNSIIKAITELMQKQQGGELVIEQSGRVKLI